MAISTAMCTSFKKELFEAEHDFTTDTFKIALYTSSATLDASTTAYTTTNEVVGTGYSAGGETLANITVTSSGITAFIDFNDIAISNAQLQLGVRLFIIAVNQIKLLRFMTLGLIKALRLQHLLFKYQQLMRLIQF